MTDTPTPVRPVPRWVRVTAVVTVVLAVVLLALGGFVTSFRAGMADPVWPTEPWYLASNFRLDLGYLVEHTHRIAGWAVGLTAAVLAVGAWRYEPNKLLRVFALLAVVFLIGAFGAFHGAMRQSWNLDKQVTPFARSTGAASLAAAVAVLAACGAALAGRHPGRWVRALAGVGLICVMIQGLLGGLRVFLNELVGTDLAAVHGVFAQVTFCVFVAAALVAAPRRAGDTLPAADRSRFVRLTALLIGLLFVQLIWAVMLRHHGTGLAQRLHILTAFAVTGVAVWLVVKLLNSPAAQPKLGGPAWHLVGILAVQLLLGVEAYVGKFAATGKYAAMPPDQRPVSAGQAAVRTAHQLVGTGLLAAAVGLAVRAGRKSIPDGDDVTEPEPVRPAAEPVAVS